MKKLRKLFSRYAVGAIGVGVSVAIAVTLVLTGENSSMSMLIGLAVIIIALTIQIIEDLEENRESGARSMSIGESVVSNNFLLKTVPEIIDNYNMAIDWDDRLFRRHARRTLLECRDTMHELAEGRMAVDYEQRRIMYGAKSKRSISLVACFNQSFWKSRYAKRVINGYYKAIKRDVSVTHIWVDNQEGLEEYRDVMENLKSIGVRVRLALLDDVPPNLVRPYRIIDSSKLVRLEVSVDNKDRAQHIIISPRIVEKARRDFMLLLEYTVSFEKFFPDDADT